LLTKGGKKEVSEMRNLFMFLIILSFIAGLAPCQADDNWDQLSTYKTRAIATDLPYIYILVYPQKVYRSTDDGFNWQLRNSYVTGLPDRNPRAVSIDPVDADILLAGYSCGILFSLNKGSRPLSPCNGALYRSVDAGSTWTKVDNPQCGMQIGGDPTSIVSNPDDSSLVFQGRDNCPCEIRKSTNRGVAWATKDKDIPSGVLALAFDPDHTDTLYAGTDGDGVWKTEDASAATVDWDSTGLTDEEVRSIVVDPTNTSVLYAATTDDVYRSSNGGSTWTRIAQDSNFTFNSLALNPQDPNLLYALRGDDYVYCYYHSRTSDWIDISEGLPTNYINQLISDLSSPDSIAVYAATDSGVYYHEEEDKEFIRGDADSDDGGVDIADAVFISNYVNYGGQRPPCMDAADVDDDSVVTIEDANYIIDYIFRSGPAPPAPFGTFPDSCGTDPTADTLNCIYSPCWNQ